MLIEPGFDGLELLEQPFNPLAARQIFGFPVFTGAAHLVGHPVVALEQSQQGHMGITLDQGREGLIAAVDVKGLAKGGEFGAQLIGNGTGTFG